MKFLSVSLLLLLLNFFYPTKKKPVVFDVHLHGAKDPAAQLATLQQAGVYKAAISTSWNLQNSYRAIDKKPGLLFGLMFPCPEGKVPYSLQPCFEDNSHWPPLQWVEEQVKAGKIDYLGEILSQYYGISPADSLLFPYYALAVKYNLPVGIHTGAAGPGHGSPHFKMEMGNPSLLLPVLQAFPSIKLWVMHAGDQHYKETIQLMRSYKKVYADISVLSNPDIVPADRFTSIMKEFIDAGLEDRLLFGSDNGNINKVINAVEAIPFLSARQKKKIYYRNAERFFKKN